MGKALKVWNIPEMAKRMPSSLLTEWAIFFKMEAEELDKEIKEKELMREATAGVEGMRNKRGRR